MTTHHFHITIELKKKLHQVIVEAKNETSARLRVLAEFKDAIILSASKAENQEQVIFLKKMKAIEIPSFLLKQDS